MGMNKLGLYLTKDPVKVRVATTWEHAGRLGILYGILQTEQTWAVLQWDGEDDPSLFKTAGLEVELPQWTPLQAWLEKVVT